MLMTDVRKVMYNAKRAMSSANEGDGKPYFLTSYFCQNYMVQFSTSSEFGCLS